MWWWLMWQWKAELFIAGLWGSASHPQWLVEVLQLWVHHPYWEMIWYFQGLFLWAAWILDCTLDTPTYFPSSPHVWHEPKRNEKDNVLCNIHIIPLQPTLIPDSILFNFLECVITTWHTHELGERAIRHKSYLAKIQCMGQNQHKHLG